jgi:ATP-dependent DNA helicase RecG
MNSLEDRVVELIQQGESSAVEFKEQAIRPESLAKEIVGMLNYEGGVILLGVSNDKIIVGVDQSKEEWIAQIATNNITPPVHLEYKEVKIGELRVGYLEIPRGIDRPYQDQSGKFYIRVGSTNRIATQVELMRLFQHSGILHYDSFELKKASANSLNFHTINQYFDSLGFRFDELKEEEKFQLMRGAEILGDNDKPTVAGLILFGIDASRVLPQSGIRFAHFKGNEMGEELIDSKEFQGALPDIIDNVIYSIKANLPNPSIIEGVKRKELNSYSDKIYREIIVNACVHRNWAIVGSQIKVFLFDNRLEVRSPGRLSNTLTIQKIMSGASIIRNPVIMRIFSNLKMMDRLGRGIPMVIQECKRLGKSVLFEEIGEEFRVTLEL